MFSFLLHLEPAATSSDLPQELEKRPDMYPYVTLPHKYTVGPCLLHKFWVEFVLWNLNTIYTFYSFEVEISFHF